MEENSNQEYFAYGHYGYYKKTILEKMFGLSDMIEIYLAEKEQLSKDGKLTPTQLKTIWRVPIKLKIAITELEPKLDKLAKLKENQYGLIKDITDIHKYSNKDLILDGDKLFYFYQKYLTFIEILGYSDMNVIKETSNPWERA